MNGPISWIKQDRSTHRFVITDNSNSALLLRQKVLSHNVSLRKKERNTSRNDVRNFTMSPDIIQARDYNKSRIRTIMQSLNTDSLQDVTSTIKELREIVAGGLISLLCVLESLFQYVSDHRYRSPI